MALPISSSFSSLRCVDTASKSRRADDIEFLRDRHSLGAKIGPFPAVHSFVSPFSFHPFIPSCLSCCRRTERDFLADKLSLRHNISQCSRQGEGGRESERMSTTLPPSRKGKFGVRVRRGRQQLDSACVIKGPYPGREGGKEEGRGLQQSEGERGRGR